MKTKFQRGEAVVQVAQNDELGGESRFAVFIIRFAEYARVRAYLLSINTTENGHLARKKNTTKNGRSTLLDKTFG